MLPPFAEKVEAPDHSIALTSAFGRLTSRADLHEK